MMIFSLHAQEQMTARGIGKPNVLAVIIDGRKSATEDNHIARYELEGLVALVDEYRGVVVTTFHDRSGAKVKKPCTRHRRKRPIKWY